MSRLLMFVTLSAVVAYAAVFRAPDAAHAVARGASQPSLDGIDLPDGPQVGCVHVVTRWIDAAMRIERGTLVDTDTNEIVASFATPATWDADDPPVVDRAELAGDLCPVRGPGTYSYRAMVGNHFLVGSHAFEVTFVDQPRPHEDVAPPDDAGVPTPATAPAVDASARTDAPAHTDPGNAPNGAGAASAGSAPRRNAAATVAMHVVQQTAGTLQRSNLLTLRVRASEWSVWCVRIGGTTFVRRALIRARWRTLRINLGDRTFVGRRLDAARAGSYIRIPIAVDGFDARHLRSAPRHVVLLVRA